VTSNLLVITLIWQSACILGLTIVELTIRGSDKKLRKDRTYYVSLVVLVVFQGVNLFLVIITSVKLTKQMLHHTASSSFLFQSYASTLVLFAGLYTVLYRITDTSFEHVTRIGDEKSVLIVDLFLRMMYYSTSNATLCGTKACWS
jgi:Kef-type K+ transport system membrane component KefB